MTNKFKVGDKVKLINKQFITEDCILIVSDIQKMIDNKYHLYFEETKFWCSSDEFELVEREIGDIWLKPEELHIHENALSIDYEATIHEPSKYIGVRNKDRIIYRKIKEGEEEEHKVKVECVEKNSGGTISYNPKNGEVFSTSYKGNKIFPEEKGEIKMDIDLKKEEFNIGDNVVWIEETMYSPNGKTQIKNNSIYKVLKVYGKYIEIKDELSEISYLSRCFKKYMSDVKEKFKVDKLGWYEANTSDKYKVVYNINKLSFVLIDGYETPQIVYWDGSVDSMDYKLIKYLGPELPKEPRMLPKWHVTMKEIIDD